MTVEQMCSMAFRMFFAASLVLAATTPRNEKVATLLRLGCSAMLTDVMRKVVGSEFFKQALLSFEASEQLPVCSLATQTCSLCRQNNANCTNVDA